MVRTPEKRKRSRSQDACQSKRMNEQTKTKIINVGFYNEDTIIPSSLILCNDDITWV